MGTIQKEIKISGICLMDGKNCDVNIFPSNEKGIRFFPKNAKEPIEAIVENVISTQNCTVLANGNSKIALVEHFMAACAFCEIDSLDICLNAEELPILDGSSKKWVEAFNEAGITPSKKNNIEINKTIKYEQGNCLIQIEPAQKLSIDYLINFEHPDLKETSINTDLTNAEEIIEARTFGYLKDLEKFQQMGLALGASIDNTVGLTEEGYTVPLRSALEPIKHKVLDLVGDLKLAGIDLPNLNAKITAKYAGHASHVEIAKILKKELNIQGENK